ncbi:DUF4245 domain-containing protein [Micromonospora peucetia]|uniref:DUF4245 domain-containing protein n=1 Tax=Micromonospora peucetia TaxID=47871 RepID=A0A1C6UFZ1_9ACTN|nr:DUF4245 domain-containing protein [Micromonospora peucetia]MCX4386678.1 DUF4245 domain-containing protein [Micromonospora peucetia]WSA34008.1 DUF4245 domain-containing protein [Micromonospora peucetia]SCL52946.1 Protein of unknown function (DUF4245) [Micromonospora peucetia]
MEPAQPADRVPADSTPPDGQPPVVPSRTAAVPEGEPALVEPADAPRAAPPDGPAETGERPAPPPAVDTRKSERSPKDMAISLLVLLIPIALLLAFYRGFLGGDQPSTVDPVPALESARAANAFPVSEPAELDDGWRTVTANFQTVEGGSSLRLGYLTPEGRGAQLVQSSVPPERLLPTELTAEGQPQGQTDLGGLTWQRYTARGNEQALVLLEPDRTVIVIGDARDNELRQLAGAIR